MGAVSRDWIAAMPKLFSLITVLFLAHSLQITTASDYAWLQEHHSGDTIATRITPPEGFIRAPQPSNSFAAWLRQLPLKHEGAQVMLYNGYPKNKPWVEHAVIDIDTGTQDLQQCADAVMRLRAEYLYSQNAHDSIHFNFTSGDKASYQKWQSGYRPVVKGNKVSWKNGSKPDSGYAEFRRYLNSVFMYAGTYSLSRELQKQTQLDNIQAGNVFIKGGFPGHAVMVVDTAEDPATGERLFLLSQSYMPAQDMHILQNPNDTSISPWYRVPAGNSLKTPEWDFKTRELMKFKPINSLRLSRG